MRLIQICTAFCGGGKGKGFSEHGRERRGEEREQGEERRTEGKAIKVKWTLFPYLPQHYYYSLVLPE